MIYLIKFFKSYQIFKDINNLNNLGMAIILLLKLSFLYYRCLNINQIKQ